MAFKKPSVKEVKTDIASLQIYLRATKKFGKTTLFRDMVLEKYGDPECGLLVGCGAEQGYAILSNLNTTQVETWQEMVELKDWLIKEKGKEHKIKLIGFDVVGELLEPAKEEIKKQSFKETGKIAKSFNASFGGYGEPRERLRKLFKDYFKDLKKAGFGVVAIAHTKVKNIKEKGDDSEGYNVLTSDLSNDLEGIFGDIFDCVLTGIIDRDVSNKKVIGEQRKLYLRGTGFVDAGCRFTDGSVPEYIVFDKPNMAKDVIGVLEEGMRLSAGGNLSKEEFKAKQKKEIEELDKKAEEFTKAQENTGMTPEEKAEAHSKIKTNLASIDMAELQRIMKDYSITDFKDAQAIPDGAYKELLDLLD